MARVCTLSSGRLCALRRPHLPTPPPPHPLTPLPLHPLAPSRPHPLDPRRREAALPAVLAADVSTGRAGREACEARHLRLPQSRTRRARRGARVQGELGGLVDPQRRRRGAEPRRRERLVTEESLQLLLAQTEQGRWWATADSPRPRARTCRATCRATRRAYMPRAHTAPHTAAPHAAPQRRMRARGVPRAPRLVSKPPLPSHAGAGSRASPRRAAAAAVGGRAAQPSDSLDSLE